MGEQAIARAPRWVRSPGVSLLGPVQDGATTSPSFLVRRADGQVVQLSHLLHTVVTRIDPRRGVDEIAESVSSDFGRTLTVEGLLFLMEQKLRPLGLVQEVGAVTPDQAPTSRPLLSLGLRGTLIPAPTVGRLAGLLAPAFHPVLVTAALVGLVVLDVRLLMRGDVLLALGDVLATPALLLALFALSTAGAIVHELGHAAACRYSGGNPGRVGFGVYLIFPAFFTNVTDSYRLSRAGRIRTDLGGLYFNVWCLLVAGTAYLVTGNGMLLLLVVLMHVEMVQQLLPLVRLDGYFILADLTGVPDLFARVGPVLRGLLPGRPMDPRVAQLRPRIRRIVTAWVLMVVPLLVYGLVWLVLNTPAIVTMTLTALGSQWYAAQLAWAAHDAVTVALAAVSTVLLTIPLAGLGVVALRLVRVLAAVARRAAAPSRPRSVMSSSLPENPSTGLLRGTPAPAPEVFPPDERPAEEGDGREPPAQSRPTQSGPTQSGPAQSGPAQSGPAQSGPAQSGPAQSGDRPEEPDRPPEPDRQLQGVALHGLTAEEFSEAAILGRAGPVAKSGWRHTLHQASGGHVSLPPGAAERRRDALLARVRAPVVDPRRVVVMSRKGGVGKTTVTVGLGATFATLRGDRVVAVDANPDAGNLAQRIAGDCHRTITDLLADLGRIDSFSQMRSYTSQCTDSRLEVLSSDDDARISQGLGRREYHQVVSLLDHYYNLVLLDTGTGILDSANQGLLEEADQLVLVIRPALDGARVGAQTLDWLDEHGYSELVSTAVVVLNGVTRENDPVIPFARKHFEQRCSHVTLVPWDRTLETGARTTLSGMAPRTREAFEDVAAALADRFSATGRGRA